MHFKVGDLVVAEPSLPTLSRKGSHGSTGTRTRNARLQGGHVPHLPIGPTKRFVLCPGLAINRTAVQRVYSANVVERIVDVRDVDFARDGQLPATLDVQKAIEEPRPEDACLGFTFVSPETSTKPDAAFMWVASVG